MRSSNPVFSRAEGFNGRGNASGMTYPGQGAPQAPQYAPPGYPSQPSYGGPQVPSGYDQQAGYDRMTIDSVVQKTGISIGLVVLAAATTWFLTGPLDSPGALGTLYHLGADPRLHHELAVTPGVRADEAAALVSRFFSQRREGTR